MKFQNTKYGRCLVISRDNYLNRLAYQILNSQGLRIESYNKITDLIFLKYYKNLHYLSLQHGLALDSWLGLEYAADCKELVIEKTPLSKPDLTMFKNLEDLFIHCKYFTSGNVTSRKLTTLGLINCQKYTNEQISPIITLKSLSFRMMSKEKIDTKLFPNISNIEFIGGNFFDISNFHDFNNLLNASFIECRNIKSVANLAGMKSLKKLIIEDCNYLESVKPLMHLPHIEFISFCGTNVRDGQIRQLLNIKSLKELYFDENKNYDLSPLEALTALQIPESKWPLIHKNPRSWARLTKQ